MTVSGYVWSWIEFDEHTDRDMTMTATVKGSQDDKSDINHSAHAATAVMNLYMCTPSYLFAGEENVHIVL